MELIHLDDTIFHQNTTSGIIAQRRGTLNHLWEIIRYAHANMHSGIKPELDQDTSHALKFKGTGSRIFVDLKIQSVGLHNLHISEYPLCQEKDIQQTLAACAPEANTTFEGVAEGMNHAYDKYFELKEQGAALFHPWFIQEEYRIEEKIPVIWTEEEKQLAIMARKDYSIELDDAQVRFRRAMKSKLRDLFPALMAEDDRTCFISSGNPFFDNRKMEVLYREARAYPGNREVADYDAWDQWEEPQKGHLYAAGADVAEGLDMGGDPEVGGRDWSVLAITCVTCKRQAFRYRARVGMDAFYRVCDQWGREYNQALLAVERNNHGHTVLQGYKENCSYPNLYSEMVMGKKEAKVGWETNSVTKAIMLDQFKQLIEGKFEDDEENFEPEITIYDLKFLQEAFTFKNKGGKLSSDAGRHDDLIVAWAISAQMYLKLRSQITLKNNISDQIMVANPTEASKLGY